MKFPSWRELTDKISEFEQSANEAIGKTVQGFQEKHPLGDKAVKTLIYVLPPPFNALAENIYSTSEGSDEQKLEKIREFLTTIQEQGEEHYNNLYAKLDTIIQEVLDLKDITAKESTLQLVSNLMISQSDALNQKLNYLIEYMGKIKRSIAISGAKGDVIGVGVDGNNNIIFKELNINISNEFRGTYGLNVLSQDHFKEFIGTEENFKGWTKGFPFSLESIYNHKDFRREALLSHMKKTLENQKRLLLLGESGTSKGTLLMEIMCDYFDNGYVVLYNFGDEEPKNAMEIVQFVRNLVKAGNKVLVAVDNVHDKKMAIIYHIINILESFIKKENIRFILTARLPEYRWSARKGTI